MALDERTGHLRLHHRAVALALAGALLGELVVAGNLVVEDGQLRIISNQPPADSLTHATLEQLAAEADHPLDVWLAYLARDVIDAVARRLALRRIIAVHRNRGLFRTTVTYPPLDFGTAAWRADRLAKRIALREALSWQDMMLAALVAASGLTPYVLSPGRLHATPHDADHLAAIVASLGDFTSLREIAAQVEALVANAVLTQRQ